MGRIGNICVCMVCAMVAAGCAGSETRRHVKPSEPVSVRTMRMEEKLTVEDRTYSGDAVASRSAVLTAPYPGTLSKLDVRKGDKVKAGSGLAEVDSESIKSSYEMAEATLRQVEDGYERLKKVSGGGGVPDVKMVEMETAVVKARATASAARKALESCVIKAPFQGTVSDVYCQQGEELQIASPLLKIVDESSVEVRFPVPENEVAGIYEGMAARVDIPALGLRDLRAEVVSKGVEAAPLSHAYECSLKITGPVQGLLPGMVCKVTLEADAVRGYVIPADVVQRDMNGSYVWAVNDGKVAKIYVRTGGFAGKGVLVSDGLSAGDEVITEGFRKVSTGMAVRIIR